MVTQYPNRTIMSIMDFPHVDEPLHFVGDNDDENNDIKDGNKTQHVGVEEVRQEDVTMGQTTSGTSKGVNTILKDLPIVGFVDACDIEPDALTCRESLVDSGYAAHAHPSKSSSHKKMKMDSNAEESAVRPRKFLALY
ncbi:hypothetical protein DH2020_021633 [Rehmannia glutinosa]|uniref:Uncharacterized protein n=1 Tax=Rehmannia glutinosa TaxID=99300 RepID=A0ABR0WD94_REHGL